jgi:hypothetical protein
MRRILIGIGVVGVFVALGSAWLVYRGSQINDSLTTSVPLMVQLKNDLVAGETSAADATLREIKLHTATARGAASDPLWVAAAAVPWFGANFAAVTELSKSADDVVSDAGSPLLHVLSNLRRTTLTPENGAMNVQPFQQSLQESSPAISAATDTVNVARERLGTIEPSSVIPSLAHILERSTRGLDDLHQALNGTSKAIRLLPTVLGTDQPRTYLVLVQNNAEIRATGGMSGALVVIRVDKGAISFSGKDTAGSLGTFKPEVKVEPIQQQMYSRRLGSFMSDVNLTPDFPTVAATASKMWEIRKSEHVDGVIAIDPQVLAAVLQATGPADMPDMSAMGLPQGAMPNQLTSENVVKTLLSDVYLRIADPQKEDVFFTAAAEAVFKRATSDAISVPKIINALSLPFTERRIKAWFAHPDEQFLISEIPAASGAISGPGIGSASFGTYFNDGTGAKMDYYIKRTVQLSRVCTVEPRTVFTAKIVLTNTAPLNASIALSKSVTGGAFGIPLGNVQTNVIAYGPPRATLIRGRVQGEAADLESHFHGGRPVGMVTVRLAPSQSQTIEFDFSVDWQGDPVEMDITPTVQRRAEIFTGAPSELCGNVR